MTIQDLGSIGEFVAAVATLATLVYLALQIRQNTRAVRTSTYQSVSDTSIRVPELILANPHLERIYRLGRKDQSQLSEEERPQFRLLVDQFMNVYETMFLQYERGTLDEDFWRARLAGLRGLLRQPGVRSHMVHRRTGANPGGASGGRVSPFNELIDSLIDETQGPAA